MKLQDYNLFTYEFVTSYFYEMYLLQKFTYSGIYYFKILHIIDIQNDIVGRQYS